MSANRRECPTGCGRAIVLIAVLICWCSFANVSCEYELLSLEGTMVVMGMDDGEVQRLESPSGSANFEGSRDVVAWRGQRDEPLFAFLRL